MIIEIGIVAGEIWHILDQKGGTLLSKIESEIDRPRDMLLMSLGWLAREGHVILEQQDADYKIMLRKEKA